MMWGDLATSLFYSVPQGFVSAEVQYNCRACELCRDWLWKPFDSTQTTARCSRQDKVGFSVNKASRISAGEFAVSIEHNRPRGIALENFAANFQDAISNPQGTSFQFFPRLLHANISNYTPLTAYTLSSLEVERSGTVWNQLIKYFGRIPPCGDDHVLVCKGTSICEFANAYSASSANSEDTKLLCQNSRTGLTFQINSTECNDIVDRLDLGLQVRSNMSNEEARSIIPVRAGGRVRDAVDVLRRRRESLESARLRAIHGIHVLATSVLQQLV
ncbi:hypothetical protein Mapa_013496 [Marchantia paleacea]|nr:hypothetical protein Mapa_013496 [Marchantia paleacea]